MCPFHIIINRSGLNLLFFLYRVIFPVQQTTSERLGHVVKYFFGLTTNNALNVRNNDLCGNLVLIPTILYY